ncbi:MAG: hypothetical protein GY880_24260 [Planctomycetaceae bacterium]|nr:hypothetical protein [Planctomycetaceae bacterium]
MSVELDVCGWEVSVRNDDCFLGTLEMEPSEIDKCVIDIYEKFSLTLEAVGLEDWFSDELSERINAYSWTEPESDWKDFVFPPREIGFFGNRVATAVIMARQSDERLSHQLLPLALELESIWVQTLIDKKGVSLLITFSRERANGLEFLFRSMADDLIHRLEEVSDDDLRDLIEKAKDRT